MLLIANKRASFDYEIREKLLAGVVLTGAEVKSLRLKMGSLTGSYVQIVDGQAVLLGAQINPYRFADNRNYDPRRTRTLLLRKNQIYRLQAEAASQHISLVPLAFVLDHHLIKLEIGVGRGRRNYEKRQQIRQKEWKKQQSALEIR